MDAQQAETLAIGKSFQVRPNGAAASQGLSCGHDCDADFEPTAKQFAHKAAEQHSPYCFLLWAIQVNVRSCYLFAPIGVHVGHLFMDVVHL